jgi:hypothetical protein
MSNIRTQVCLVIGIIHLAFELGSTLHNNQGIMDLTTKATLRNCGRQLGDALPQYDRNNLTIAI